jgi:hypothetical protein
VIFFDCLFLLYKTFRGGVMYWILESFYCRDFYSGGVGFYLFFGWAQRVGCAAMLKVDIDFHIKSPAPMNMSP